jgi:hypothetical protein
MEFFRPKISKDLTLYDTPCTIRIVPKCPIMVFSLPETIPDLPQNRCAHAAGDLTSNCRVQADSRQRTF